MVNILNDGTKKDRFIIAVCECLRFCLVEDGMR